MKELTLIRMVFSGALLVLLLSACTDAEEIAQNMGGLPVPEAPARQLDAKQLALGKQIFADNCAQCHGDQAQGTPNWRKRDADGHYPAPPLNGSGHGWHHSTEVLGNVINNGSVPGQGKMPAWEGKLSAQEVSAVIAWFQSTWPQPVYNAWFEMQQRGR
jgi:mono/diheme cytochrome c family protein